MKMLALSFLILIGVMLVGEAFGQHIDKGYIYFAMAFSLGVEMLNMRLRGKGDAGRPAALRDADRSRRRGEGLRTGVARGAGPVERLRTPGKR